MPAEFDNCVRTEVERGKSRKDAQRICAIAYFKRHGRPPSHASIFQNDPVLKLFFNTVEAQKEAKKE